MTISTTTVKNSYSGDGSTATFNYTFKVLADTDLTVIIRNNLGTETTKTLSTHYTITGVGDAAGGSITFTSSNIPSATDTVVLLRDTAQTQSIDYIANDPFPAETHEEGLDRSVILSQELQEEVDRSIKISRTNTMTSTEFTVGPTERAGKFLSFDSNGELVVSQEVGTFKGNWSSGQTYAARDIVKDSSNNNIYLANTGHTSSGTTPLSSNADIGKWDLLVDAASATTSATNAANSATAAATSETNAATSASTATTKASEASTSATNAATSETNAETAKTAAEAAQSAAEAALDTFDDKFLGSKSADPTLDNDGNALTDGALYFNTTDDVMKVYDLGNTQWKQLTPTTSQQTNIDTVAANDTNITTVAGQISPTNNISSVASNSSNINTVASSITNVNNVGNNIANVNTTAANITGVNSFGERYRVSSSAPTTSLDAGDLYFDTTSDTMKVYGSSGWQNAGSSVNGTSARFTYTISGTPTTVSGVDDNGETLAYDAGFADVYVNGVRMSSADITITSGTSVVFASALTNGDVVDIVAYGTFNVATVDGSNITSGTISNSRLTGNGAITINGSAVSLGGSVTVGETKPTVSSVSPSTITNAQTSVTITGTNFLTGASVEAVGTDGSIIVADTVSFTNSTTLVANFTIATDSTYFIRVENTDGNAARSSTAILTVSDAPTWTTAAGSLGSIAAGDSVSLSVAATSDSTVAYSETTSVLTSNANTPAGTMNLSLNSSTGAITGTAPSPTSETTYNFTLRATDNESQTADRAFSITVTVGINNGGQFN